ncbi:ankyrin repeat and LEM domain-containing protein 2 isoform X2 [Gouania willdenowi]|nr:ankyrin repeat and LEM domain-containing protein 2 isoform X2 [Gouania willdenowi]
MEAVLSRLRKLSADELREEFARADLKCGPITQTTRATFERKLARALTGPDSSNSETDSSSLADTSSNQVKCIPATCATSTVITTASAGEELDFGYGLGLNPPQEVEMPMTTSSNSSTDHSIIQFKTQTPSMPAQESPTFYYGVCPLSEDVVTRNEGVHVYTEKKDALQAVKMIKGARFKAFPKREDAEKFALGMLDYFPSPSRSTPCISPIKPGLVPSKDNMEVDAINRERANSFKSPRTQDLTSKLRKTVERGDESAFFELIWSNPRYLIGSGDNPTIVQEGCRYNVLHVAAKENQAGIAQLLLDTLENPEFMRLMYPDDQDAMLQKRIRYIVDLYLNTPDKAGFETSLHFACKFGCPDVVNVLCTHPDIDKNCKNKDGLKPSELICSRRNKTPEVKQKILDFLEDRCYVPLLRATDNSSQPIISSPWLPETSESFSLIQRHTRSPVDPMMTVTAFAGPLSPAKADDFCRSWKTPPRDRAEFHHLLKSDPDRGVERVGRDLAHEMGHPWAEYWDFLDSFVDLSSAKGLHKLEEYFSKKDLSSWSHEEAGENEASNRFKTPSPGKPKKFCNSISIGAFLDEGDDISREEKKNRQNTVLTSITSSAASKDVLKGAVGGLDFHHRGADLIETAAEQDFLCCCNDSLLSPGMVCQNKSCVSSRDRTQNGDRGSPSPPPATSYLLSPISNLMVEFDRMSLQEPLENPASCQERGNSERLDSYSSSSVSDPVCGLDCLSLGDGSEGGDAVNQPSWRTDGAGTKERLRSSSSEEYFDVEETAKVLGQTREALTGMNNSCARSKSWDHGSRDLSSSGSSTSSYKSLDNSREFLQRTPQHVRRLFIDGNSPSKLDREVLSAIEQVDIDPQKFPNIDRWKNMMKSYSASEMQSWPSPAGVKPRHKMLPHTPSSPISGLVSPSTRYSPAQHIAPPDFSPGRYSPANIRSIQRIRLKHLNGPTV